mmetsp:Transcript_87220/g.281749  ORF Transcript_87220/g.281749 Transcript_87220/m.281749 type:complete len:543 (-) Transcript_87220:1082-2710(-)
MAWCRSMRAMPPIEVRGHSHHQAEQMRGAGAPKNSSSGPFVVAPMSAIVQSFEILELCDFDYFWSPIIVDLRIPFVSFLHQRGWKFEMQRSILRLILILILIGVASLKFFRGTPALLLLGLTFYVSDGLAHIFLVLDDRHSVHLVVLPIRLAPSCDRSVPESAVVGDPHASAMPTALEELAHVGATLAIPARGDVMHAIAVRQVILPHTVVRDVLHLRQVLVVDQVFLDEDFELAVFEGRFIHRPIRGVRVLLRRPYLSRLEGLQKAQIFLRFRLVEGTNTLELAVLSDLAVIESAVTFARPRGLPECRDGVVFELAVEDQAIVVRAAERSRVVCFGVHHGGLGTRFETNRVPDGLVHKVHVRQVTGAVPNVLILDDESLAVRDGTALFHGLGDRRHLGVLVVFARHLAGMHRELGKTGLDEVVSRLYSHHLLLQEHLAEVLRRPSHRLAPQNRHNGLLVIVPLKRFGLWVQTHTCANVRRIPAFSIVGKLDTAKRKHFLLFDVHWLALPDVVEEGSDIEVLAMVAKTHLGLAVAFPHTPLT